MDFTALAEAALKASKGVEVHGPVEQGAWLEVMGIRERAEMLVKGMEKGKVESIEGAWKRLTDRSQVGMGKVYKVMAVTPENGGKALVGFGGDL